MSVKYKRESENPVAVFVAGVVAYKNTRISEHTNHTAAGAIVYSAWMIACPPALDPELTSIRMCNGAEGEAYCNDCH